MPRPSTTEYSSFYQGYIDKVSGDDALEVMEQSLEPLQNWLETLTDSDLSISYAPGKWTLGQLLQHMIDAERVFAYRAMCFGRGEQQNLPGFDENAFAEAATAHNRKLKGLAEELFTLRKASTILFRSLDKENAIQKSGIANNKPISVNAIAFLMVGHVLHHIEIINSRYLLP